MLTANRCLDMITEFAAKEGRGVRIEFSPPLLAPERAWEVRLGSVGFYSLESPDFIGLGPTMPDAIFACYNVWRKHYPYEHAPARSSQTMDAENHEGDRQ